MCDATINVKVSSGIAHQFMSQLVLPQKGWTMNPILSQKMVQCVMQQ